ncbi:hypothetical protein D3C75_1123600 [compost metagenome]
MNRKVWSANSSGSPCSRLISNWLTPISCMKVSRGRPSAAMHWYTSLKNGRRPLLELTLNAEWPSSRRPSLPTGGWNGCCGSVLGAKTKNSSSVATTGARPSAA